MRLRRAFTLGAALAATVSLSIAAPAHAGNTLLGGYGGPGQGSQVILGATLINGPSGSGGSSGGSASGGGSTGALSPAVAAATGAPAAAAGQPDARSSGGQVSAARGTGGSGSTPGARPAYTPTAGGSSQSLARASTPTAAVGATTLGLSGQDLLYVALVLAALVLTGLSTMLLARRAAKKQAP